MRFFTYHSIRCLTATLLLTLSGISLASTPAIKFKQADILNVISCSEFIPISYDDGKGYEADLLKSIAQLWDVKIKFHSEKFYEGSWRLPSRSYTIADVAIGGFTPMEYRVKEGASFSVITTYFSQSLLVRKKDYESGKITSYQSFKNTAMKIGVVPGTTGEQYAHVRAMENGLPASVFIQYRSESELLPALKNGEIDAIARGQIGNEHQQKIDKSFISIANKSFCEGFSFAVNKSNPLLLNELNKAILQITDNGKIAYKHWVENHNVFKERVDQLKILARNKT
jgi:ABC-type amino acid transport substrate-binding protein